MDRDAGGTALDAAAHVGKDIDEADIALEAVPWKIEDSYAAPTDCRCGEKITGGRGIGFDVVGPIRVGRVLVQLTARNVEADVFTGVTKSRRSKKSDSPSKIGAFAAEMVATFEPPLLEHLHRHKDIGR